MLNNPHAQGPNSLPSAVPGGQMADIMPSGNGVGSNPIQAPVAPMRAPAAQPMPQPSAPAPQPQASSPSGADEFNSVDPKALAEFNDGPPGGPPAPPKSEFDGKNVEGKFMGMKVRVNTEGVPQIWAPAKDKWVPIGDGQGQVFNKVAKGLYSAFQSLPDTAGNVVASALPGEGPAIAAARVGISGIASATSRASGLSAGISNYILNKMYNPKDLFILKKIAGYQNEPSAMASGVSSAAGQVIGEVAGSLMKSQADKAATSSVENSQLLSALKQGQPLEQAAREAGIPIRGTQIAAQLPGGASAVAQESSMANGSLGTGNQIAIQLENQNQAQAIGQSVDNLIKKVAPNVDFDNMDISKISGSGGQRLTFIDRLNEASRQTLSANRSAVGELARDRQFNPSQIVQTFESAFKSLASHEKDLVKPDGSIDVSSLMDLAKREGYSDRSLGDFARSYLSLKNLVSRDSGAIGQNSLGSVVSPQSGMGAMGASAPGSQSSALLPQGAAGEAQAGMTFKQLSSYVDRLQDLAFQSDGKTQFSRAMVNAASAAKGLEDDVTAQMFMENGQPHMAQRVIQQKQKYASTIDDMNALSASISRNPDNAANSLFSAPAQSLKRVLPALSDQQRQEIAGSLLTNAAYNDISNNSASSMIDGINADRIKQTFFGTQEARMKSEMIFGDSAPQLESILNVAKVIQSNNKMSTSQQISSAGRIGQMAMSLVNKKFPLDKLGVLLNAVTEGKPAARDLINTSLSDLILKQEALASKSATKAVSLDRASSILNSKSVKNTISGAVNLLTRSSQNATGMGQENENSK